MRRVVVSGDYCAKIALDSSISLKDFYFLNPVLNEGCSNLEREVSYCVAAVGDITTYPGYVIEMPSTSFTRPTPTTTGVVLPTETLNPHAPGTLDNCTEYTNFVDPAPYLKEFGVVPWPEELNLCTSFAGKYDVSVSQLLSWNPSLSSAKCEFLAGYSYCVRRANPVPGQNSRQSLNGSLTFQSATETTTNGATETSVITSSTSTETETQPAPAPSPTQPGTISSCVKYHFVKADDGACDGIIAMYGLNRDDFFKWNTQVGEYCELLWLDYYVCVGV
ncbi:unnamed protein product [Clonostachys solani]|uniref:LysM domain-containing protein n=1 Tax=Clonostachys solani TaxID=160281 RepID=A0A9N9YZ73_9HYPO|nr:unnamed protein product [Clonostachys solani]